MRKPSLVILLAAYTWLFQQGGAAQYSGYFIDTYAGSDAAGDGGAALDAPLGSVEGVAADQHGNLYIADNLDHRIRRVDAASGLISTIAGTGSPGYSGDNGPGTAAQVNRPYGVAVDEEGNVFFADFGNDRVRRIRPDGVIETVAGGGSATSGLGGALSARLEGPRNIAVDSSGNLYISDFTAHKVYRVSPSGMIATVAGTGVAGYDEDGTVATEGSLNSPAGLAVAPDGTLYVADSGNHRVRSVKGGVLRDVVGGDVDGVELYLPTGVALDPQGFLYVADSGNGRLVWRDPDGSAHVMSDPLGNLDRIRDVTFHRHLFAGGGQTVSTRRSTGELVTVAGGGVWVGDADGVDAIAARLSGPIGVGLDPLERLLIVEESGHRVRMVGIAGSIHTVAGNGAAGWSGDGEQAAQASLEDPVAVATDTRGRTWIADYLSHRLRRVSHDGFISTPAGDGTAGEEGDGARASSARLNHPRGLAADRYGGVYVADSGNHRVRYIDSAGTITTVAGTGAPGFGGDLGPASGAQLHTPSAVAVAYDGTLFIADTGNNRIRRVGSDGTIMTAAGNGIRGFSGDGGPALEAALADPTGLAVDVAGNLWIADTGNNRVRVVSTEGVIGTAAGDGAAGFRGDGGAAVEARLNQPSGVAIAPGGVVYVADLGNHRIRRLVKLFTDPVIEPLADGQILHAATLRPGPLAPGQIVSIFGDAIGPEEPLTGVTGADGSIGTTLGGYEVRFDGQPAPIFYAGPGQFNLQLPHTLAALETAGVEILRDGLPTARGQITLASAAPGLFTLESGAGPVVALNEDRSLNSSTNPATRGTIVTIFATGEGEVDPPIETGEPAASPLPKPVLPVSIRIGGLPAEVLYAGAAPGYSGLLQVNFRLPGGFSPTGILPLELYVGSFRSQSGVTIAVR